MIVDLVFSQIDRIETRGAFRAECCDNILTRESPVPRRRVSASTLPEISAEIEAFVSDAIATGTCGRVFAFDRSQRGVRAIRGFKKLTATNGGILVNELVGIAAADAATR